MDDKVKCPVTGRTWDLAAPRDQQRAMALLRKSKPKLLMASPPCSLFCTLQRFNPQPSKEAYEKAVAMVNFFAESCIEQV